MTISCPECAFSKEVDLPSGIFRVVCPKCKHKFTIEETDDFLITTEDKPIETVAEQGDRQAPSESFICPECNNALSKKKAICPHCGYPIESVLQQPITCQEEVHSGNLCRECGKPVADIMSIRCPNCGIGAPLAGKGVQKSEASSKKSQQSSSGLVVAGYICIAVGFFVFGIILSPISFVIGIINAKRGNVGHGVAQICLSIFVLIITLVAILGLFV